MPSYGNLDELEAFVRNINVSVERTVRMTTNIEILLDQYKVILREVDVAVEDSRSILEQINEPQRVTEFVLQWIEILKDSANDTLAEYAKQAAESSEEYSRQPLLDLLVLACKQKGSITITPSFSGWNSRIVVDIDLDRTAGSIENWAGAVTRAREQNEWNKTDDPIQASMIWRDSIFKHSNAIGKRGKRYASADLWRYTIDERLGLSGGIAPFWKLLDRGNFVSMSSDRGGVAYPRNKPADFVKKTIDFLEREFLIAIKDAEVEYMRFRDRVWNTVTDLRNLQGDLQGRIEELDADISRNIEYNFGAEEPATEPSSTIMEKTQALIDSVARKYKLPTGFAQSPKFASIVLDIAEYGNVINSKVTKEGRVEITMSSGYRFRVYVKKLKRAFARL